MNRRLFSAGLGMLWLALPVTGLRYWMVWDQLPARIATHFNAAGEPNGWMTRETSCIFAMVLTAFVLAVFTAILIIMRRTKSSDALAWAFLAFSCVIVGVVLYANESVLGYNLSGRPVNVTALLIIVPVAAIIFTAVYLGSKRGAQLPQHTWLAEEVHGSRTWAVIFLIPILIELGVFVSVPLPSIRVGLAVMFVVFTVVSIHAWTGFQYRFSPAGVEISTLGFRLRSIPRNQISEYAEQSWSPLGGYGIRGVGRKRAYVWGNRGVLIKTYDGEVFLGHNEPQRIIRDLDAVRQYVHS